MSKWRATISFGEALSISANLGVLIGLVLVWMEIRQSQTQLAADVELRLAESYQTIMGRTVENDDVADLLLIAYENPESLSPNQFLRLMSIHAEWMAVVYATYSLWQSEAISRETWELHSNYYLLLLQTDWSQDFWRGMHHEGMYPQDFMKDLESRMPETVDQGSD